MGRIFCVFLFAYLLHSLFRQHILSLCDIFSQILKKSIAKEPSLSIYTAFPPFSIKHRFFVTNSRATFSLYPFARNNNSTPFYNVCSIQTVSTVIRCSFFILFLNKDSSFAGKPRAPPVFLLMKKIDFLGGIQIGRKGNISTSRRGKNG